MNAKNKIAFLDERIVGDYKVCYITFDFEKHINVFFFFHFKFNKRVPSLYARYC